MTSHLIEVTDLKAYYKTPIGDVKAVNGVNFTLGEKEIFGIAGESGCGKTTLAKSVLGLLKPPGYIYGGKMLFKGTDLLSLDEESLREIRGSQISYIPQSSMNALNPVMRILDQIKDMIRAHENWPKEKVEEKSMQLLKMVALPERCSQMFPHQLSGGMKQRAIIDIAIALSPALLIADEPTTALDVVVQRAVLQVIAEIKEKIGSSIVLITHDMAVHAEVADRMAIMYAGKIVEIGNAYDIFQNPLHPYTKALISSIPTIEERRKLTGLHGRPPNLIDPPSGCGFHPRCAFATERCKRENPVPREIKPGRTVACHLYGG
ncbi:MAG: ABC transporter ATP-binding protein [Candidatus Bathyarchaeia archaeon]